MLIGYRLTVLSHICNHGYTSVLWAPRLRTIMITALAIDIRTSNARPGQSTSRMYLEASGFHLSRMRALTCNSAHGNGQSARSVWGRLDK